MNKILSLLHHNQIKAGYFLIFLMFINSLLEFFGLGLVLLIINSFLNIDSNNILQKYLVNFFEIKEEANYLKIVFLFLLSAFSIKFLIQVYSLWKENYFLADIRKTISSDLYQNFLSRSPEKVVTKNSAEYLRNFVEDINLTLVFYTCCVKIILDLLLFLSFTLFLILFEPRITLFVIIIFGLVAIVYYYSVRKRLLVWAKSLLKNKKKRIQFINESFSAIKYIKIFSAEKFFLNKFQFENKSLSYIMRKQNFIGSLPRYILEYILFATIMVLLIILSQLNYEKNYIIQILSVYTIAAFRIVPIFSKLLTNSQQIRYSFPALEKLYFQSKQKTIFKPKKITNFIFNKSIQIKFKNFGYKSAKKNSILKNVNMIFPKNSKIGIIGPSGSGKSTLIDMICGFLLASKSSMTVKVDDKPISKNLSGWQNLIGYIPQNIVILNSSLRENILFGSKSNNFTDKEILEVLKKVELDKFFRKLSLGLSHQIKEDGLNISGGEKQRIGMARALLRNPEVIVFDEATSGLDFFTEKKILKTIKKINKTAILVSHRVGSLNFCDKIYSIENNTVKKVNIRKNTI